MFRGCERRCVRASGSAPLRLRTGRLRGRAAPSRSREAHEVYATFISTTITAEKKENKRIQPADLLKNYPTYWNHYEKGRLLTAAFQGHYLKEVALTAIIISCFQSQANSSRDHLDQTGA